MHFHMVAIFFRTKNGGPLVEGRAALRVPDPKWLVDDCWLVVSTAPKNMKVSWDDNSQHMEKTTIVSNHKPESVFMFENHNAN